MIKERVNEPTPNGGAYSEAVYLDNKWQPVEQMGDASIIVVSEYTKDGKLIKETYCRI